MVPQGRASTSSSPCLPKRKESFLLYPPNHPFLRSRPLFTSLYAPYLARATWSSSKKTPAQDAIFGLLLFESSTLLSFLLSPLLRYPPPPRLHLNFYPRSSFAASWISGRAQDFFPTTTTTSRPLLLLHSPSVPSTYSRASSRRSRPSHGDLENPPYSSSPRPDLQASYRLLRNRNLCCSGEFSVFLEEEGREGGRAGSTLVANSS